MSESLTTISYLNRLPPLSELQPPLVAKNFLFIVDQRVYSKNPAVSRWLKSAPFVYLVKAGEQLKDLQALPEHLSQIFKLLGDHAQKGLIIVALGGGSVGDFAGFVASVFKRGIPLIQIPSSWLAAIDSAHGGKNGLNLLGMKNQIGTFWHPRKVLIVDQVLASLPPAELEDAWGELYKMALITSAPWGQKCVRQSFRTQDEFRLFLPHAIKEKYRIVQKDPTEQKGLRQILNLGHTFGHVIELEQGIPHGRAVAIGLRFALALSAERSLMSHRQWELIKKTPMFDYLQSLSFHAISEHRFREILSQDKKRDSQKTIRFVFLKTYGLPKVLSVSIDELITAGKKYGFIQKRAHRNH